ncbi:MAG TPA: nucleotidyltransferase family protein, partial [Verrucomicrobiae bacterium]|nr:nucleotidyltransferase family protein [Verrucomicrobiae bacterium]
MSMLQVSLSETSSDPAIVLSALDWSMLQRLVRHHRVGPLLSYSVRRSRIRGIPDWLRSEWDSQRRETVATALYHVQALEELAGLFEARDIPFILLKGEALSKTCYPDEGLRPYSDIDLLIKESSYEAARAALTAVGFCPRHPHLETEKRTLFGEVEFDRQGPRTLTVDLHWDTLMVSWGPPSLLSAAETWGLADQIQIGRQLVSVLGGETLLLHLCVHFTFHHAFDGLILLCDLFLVLMREGGRIDWDRLLRKVDRYRCRYAVYYALTCVQSLLGAHIPSPILKRLRPAIPVRLLMPV